MATIIDLLRHLGRDAAPDGGHALAGPITLPATSEAPLPLPLPAALTTAWARRAGRPTHAYHALALSAAQAGESLALMGHGPAAQIDLLLPLLQHRLSHPAGTTLCIAPADATVRAMLLELAAELGLRCGDAGSHRRPHPAALVLTTPEQLQQRLLPAADRAWRWLWPRLDQLALPLLHTVTGIAAGHLHWLLRRVERLATRAPLQIIAALAPVADAESSLERLIERPCRVIAAPAGAPHPTLVALWRCGPDRAATALRLYRALRERQLAATLLGRDPAETERLARLAPEDDPPPGLAEARIAIVTGVPRSPVERQALLRLGQRLLILLAGDEPHELLFADKPERLTEALPQWPLALANPYVASAALACAALEQPLSQADIDRWQIRELRDRLLRRGTLRALPGDDLWAAGPDAAERCAELEIGSVGGPAYQVIAPDGRPIDRLPPAFLDRCALPGQVWRPGLAVARRDDAAAVVQLRDDAGARLTLPLARIEVAVREELAARSVHVGARTFELVRGKALVTHRVAGLLDVRAGTPPRELAAPGAETQWSAAACWFELPVPPPDPRVAGWSLTQALPLVTLGHPASLLCAYDAALQRLYLLEAEPGGSGVIERWYARLEQLLEWAARLTAACRAHPLYAPLATAEAVWLDALQSPAPATLRAAMAPSAARDPAPASAVPETAPAEPAPARSATPVERAPEPPPEEEAEEAMPAPAPEETAPPALAAETAALPAEAPAPAPSATPPPPPATEPRDGSEPAGHAAAATPRTDAAPASEAENDSPGAEPPVDVAAMIARMRRLREQRAAAGQAPRRDHTRQAPPPADDPAATQELRFHIGERVQCLPYGVGIVRASRLVNGREQLTVEFPEYGAIEIDPAVSLVRALGRDRNDQPAED